MQLIILAAGKGSRLPKRLGGRPKCLIKIKDKTLIEYNKEFIDNFKKKIIITGYQSSILKKKTKNFNLKYIRNKKYNNTNMVYSLSLAKKHIIKNEDIVVIYGDIIFDKQIIKLLKKNGNLLPVNKNWLNNWKSRMKLKQIIEDAESIIVKKNCITQIGDKIKTNNLPKYQFMGIIKFKIKTFNKIMYFFKSLKNKNIDMTSFLNICIQKKILKLNAIKNNFFWYEIDTKNDYKFALKELS